jgi:hypothetical protein
MGFGCATRHLLYRLINTQNGAQRAPHPQPIVASLLLYKEKIHEKKMRKNILSFLTLLLSNNLFAGGTVNQNVS